MVERLYAALAAPVIRSDPDTACMVKYASNAFHALKVVFANEIGQLCKQLGGDGTEVMEVICRDTRLTISARYLRPGFAFGGSCLPKDLRALQYLARHNDLQLPVIDAILPSNRLHIQSVVDLILRDNRRKVGIIGLAFKPGTDDLRESPVVELVEILSGKGIQVRIYDQHVNLSRLTGRNKAFIEAVVPHIAAMLCTSIEELVGESEVIVVAHGDQTDHRMLADLLSPDQLLVDLVKIPSYEGLHRFAYQGVCW